MIPGVIRVLVWARSAVMRAGLEALVREDPGFEILVPQFRSADLLTAIRDCAPDVILLDTGDNLNIPPLPDVLSAPDAPSVVALIERPLRSGILRLLQSGVRGLLPREAHPEEIADSLSAVHRGLAVMSPEILDSLVPAIAELPASDDLPIGEPLTPREIEVLAMLADGAGNKEIARSMKISEHTVKFHVSSILNKLGAATRTEAVTRGYKEGLILI